jgi:hypothetical protein
MVDKKIFFVRVPKTSSSTICRNIVGPNNKRLNIHDGHFPYGIGGEGNDVSYFTFLRDPVKRWISVFCQNFGRKRHLYKLFLANNSNSIKFLKACLETETHCNVMAKQLSGLEKRRDVEISKSKPDDYIQYYNPSFCRGKRKYTDEENDNFLKVAICNLYYNFDFVGICEKSDTEYKRLCDFYGWSYPAKIQNHMVTSGKVKKKASRALRVDNEEAMDLIKQINRLDIEIYNQWVNKCQQ